MRGPTAKPTQSTPYLFTGGLARVFLEGNRAEAIVAAVLRAAESQHLEHAQPGVGVGNNSRQQGLVPREP